MRYRMYKADFDNGVDHWADCEDPLNCNCDGLTHCIRCNGYGGIIVRIGIYDHMEPCPECEDGLVLKSEV